MSLCRQFGKDKVIFLTAQDQRTPSTVRLAELDDRYEPKGLILPNGQVNWNCPCLGGMAAGPCGFYFRQAFGCFHQSEAQPKGGDCIDKFSAMQECMVKYPNLYPQGHDKDEPEPFSFDPTPAAAPTPQPPTGQPIAAAATSAISQPTTTSGAVGAAGAAAPAKLE